MREREKEREKEREEEGDAIEYKSWTFLYYIL